MRMADDKPTRVTATLLHSQPRPLHLSSHFSFSLLTFPALHPFLSLWIIPISAMLATNFPTGPTHKLTWLCVPRIR